MASELKKKTIHGLKWNSIQQFSLEGFQFLVMLIMARLLSPTDYGTVGMITVFIAISGTFVNCGFTNALIRMKNPTQADLSTAFFFNLLVSILFYIILFFVAPFVANFYNMPILKNILRVQALTLIIGAFNAVQMTTYTINLDFKRQAQIGMISSVVASIFGITMAYTGFGVWALVYQTLFGGIFIGLLYWIFSSWRPSLIFSKKSFKSMFDYGSKLMLSGLIDTTYRQIYPIVIGKFFSAATLGNFSRARHWASLPSKNLTGILKGVTFPVLAKIQDDDKRLENIYRRMIKTSCYIIFPIMIGLSAVAKPLTLVTIGEKWLFSAYLLHIICFSMMWYPVHSLNLNLLMIKGRSDLFLKLEIIKKIVGICILCVSVPLGIVAMCYFGIISSIISLIINTYYTGKLIHVGFFKQMRDIAPTLLLSMVMWVIVLTVIHFIPNIYIQLVVGILIGATIYLAGSYFFKFPELKEVLVMYKDIKNKKK